jgi:hypothetical protein
MSENQEGTFKVSDRRLFNPDGTLREEVVKPEEPALVAPEPPPAAGAQPQRAREPEPEPSFAAEAPEEVGEAGEATEFMDFLMQIASSAFIYLGLVEHPATGARQVDLEAAQQTIDMLAMLRQKTRNNLTRQEEQFFEDLLADLRMQFVSLKR